MTRNMTATKTWLRDNGFTCKGCAYCRLLVLARGALAALSQPHTNGDLPEDWRSK